MAFDGIVTKSILEELKILIDAKLDKIYQPDSNNILLGFYSNRSNYSVVLSIDPSYYRINLTTHTKPNPINPSSFCMLLRKHLIGARLKNINMIDLERIVYLEFESYNSNSAPTKRFLILELMGKHSNLILVNESFNILGCLRYFSQSYRELETNKKYLPPISNKSSFLEIKNFDEFYSIIEKNLETKSISNAITSTFVGISPSFIKDLEVKLEINDISKESLKKIYDEIQKILSNIASNKLNNLTFEIKRESKNNRLKDYTLSISPDETKSTLNSILDDFYFEKEKNETFINYRNTVLTLLLQILKKYQNRLKNMDAKLEECNQMDKYKLYGELITANLYQIPKYNCDEIEVENYYDNSKIITIPLNAKYSPSINAKRFFKKYQKLKNAFSIVNEQKQDTIMQLKYIESIVCSLENASTLQDIDDIYEEIKESGFISNKQKDKRNSKNIKTNKQSKKRISSKKEIHPLSYTIDGFTVLVGRNNKENDELTTHFANSFDLWFHTKDIHGSHVILRKSNNQNIETTTIQKVAQVAAYYSKARLSSNVPVDYCEIQYVKKPKRAKPGMVIYKNNNTVIAMPKLPEHKD